MAESLTREEFLVHIEYVRADVKVVKDHLEMLNGRTRELEQDLAVLKDRDTRAAVAWGGGVGGLIVGVVEGVRWLVSR